MSFLAKLWSMLFGGGTIVSAVDDAIKLGSQVTAEVHDHNQVVAGENKIIADDNAQAAKAEKDALEIANNTSAATVDDSLRTGKF